MSSRAFHEISVSEIAREAKASVSSLYARFPAKESLLGAVYERYANAQRDMFDKVLSPDRWNGFSLSGALRVSFPVIVAGYRERQGLLRAFLDQASKDVRFRNTWADVGDHVVVHVTKLVTSRPNEVNHSNPENGVRIGLGIVFSALAHQVQMHRIDDPSMDELTEQLILMMLRYMGIPDAPNPISGQ